MLQCFVERFHDRGAEVVVFEHGFFVDRREDGCPFVDEAGGVGGEDVEALGGDEGFEGGFALEGCEGFLDV